MRPPICDKTAPPHLENPGSATGHVPAMHSGRPTTVLPQMSTVQKDRMTDACENITLPQTLFTGGKNVV